jgi:hypothetical protein
MTRDHKLDDPAFPHAFGQLHTGMTLRDWFAGQALSSIADSNAVAGAEATAINAYRIADAMLKERDK